MLKSSLPMPMAPPHMASLGTALESLKSASVDGTSLFSSGRLGLEKSKLLCVILRARAEASEMSGTKAFMGRNATKNTCF